MLTKEEISKILITARGGADFSELYFEESTSTSIKFESGRIEEIRGGIDKGVSLRVVKGDKEYFSYTTSLDFDTLYNMAVLIGKIFGRAEEGKIEFRDMGYKNPSIPEILPGEVSVPEKIEIVKRADKAAREYDPAIVQVMVFYGDTQKAIDIYNSYGEYTHDDRIYTSLIVQTVATDGKDVQTGYEVLSETIGFELFKKIPSEEVAKKAAHLAITQLRAEPAPAGTYTVVLSSSAGGTMIHEACGHGLEADLIEKGGSVYKGKIGKKVANELITVVDDGTLPGKRGTTGIDDEGIPSQRVVLIENGILKGYLHSRKTAKKFGVAPTGNGRRESFRHLPIPRMRNTMVLPGNHDPDEIVKSVEKGVLIKKMGGGQVDIASGDFVFNCPEAYLIENGRPTKALRGATLIGNGPKVLESIDMVGSDLGFSVGTCGKDGQGVPVSDAQPTVRIPQIVVGGIVK